MGNINRKIVYLLPGGLYNSGGMERVITIKANYFAENLNYDVSIVTTEQMGRPVFYPISDKVRLYHLDIGIHENFGKESYLRKCISRFYKTKEYKKSLEKLLCEIRPDFTISALGLDIDFLHKLKDGSIKFGELHFPGNFRQLMARKLSGSFIPNVVAKYRTIDFKNKCLKLAQFIVLTEEEKSSWKIKKNIRVIPNPLPSIPIESSTTTAKKVIAVGRLAYEKGFDLLIQAWKEVAIKHPDWELNIYGSGNQKDNLIQLIKESHLEGVINIYDPVKNIYDQYLNSSILVLPSRYLEALPMILIEAMSCGLPLIAFDSPCGPKDVITDGENGFLVKSGDTKAFSDRINYLIESDVLRKTMGITAKEYSFNYRIEILMKRWINLFEEFTHEDNSSIGS